MNKNVYYNFFDFFKKTIFYKISLIVVYIVAIFGILSSPGDANVFKTLYFNFANPYLIEALIILSIINIIFLNKTFFQSYPSFIRSTNRKQYFDDLLKKIFVTNNNIFNNYFLISLLLSILKNFGKISMEIYTFYNIPLIFYDFLLIIRLFCMIHLISIFTFFIIKFFKNNYIYAIIFILVISYFLFYWVYDLTPVSSISGFKFFYGYYLLGFNCINFPFEILLSCIYIVCLYNIVMIIKIYIERNLKDNVI